VNKIKTEGRIPAVIYGAHHASQNLELSARELSDALAKATGEHLLVELQIDNQGAMENALALIQEVQHHPVRRSILHVDFHAVRPDEKMHTPIPVETYGEPTGVKNFGGILEQPLREIEVECLPLDLPDIIRVDVSALNVGDSIHVRDIALPSGVTARSAADAVVIHVASPTVEIVASADAPAQPEVLKEKKPAAGAADAKAADPKAKKK
jgi:large subunit ribosomal protein L25